MIIRYLDIDPFDAGALLFALAQTEPNMIEVCNWPEVAPYKPKVVFRAFHTGDYLVIRYDVLEKCTAARITEFGGNVCKDSCVEFFIDPDGKGERYYNFESSCIGVMHNGYHELPSFKLPASQAIYESIPVYPSVGYTPFDEIIAGQRHGCGCHHSSGEEDEHHCHCHGENEGEHHCCHEGNEGEHHCCHEGNEDEHHCCHEGNEGEHQCHCHSNENSANYWHLTLAIPISALFRDKYSSWKELSGARCNFYKCGDALSMPHYLSWAPVGTDTPKFHAPQFFREVEFE